MEGAAIRTSYRGILRKNSTQPPLFTIPRLERDISCFSPLKNENARVYRASREIFRHVSGKKLGDIAKFIKGIDKIKILVNFLESRWDDNNNPSFFLYL